MKISRHLTSVSSKWIIIQTILFVITFTIITAYLYVMMEKEIYQEVEMTGRTTAQALRDILRNDPHVFNRDHLNPIVLRFVRNIPYIRRVSIIDHTYKIISDSDVQAIGKMTDERTLISLVHSLDEKVSYYRKDGQDYIRVSYSIEGSYNPAWKSNIWGAASLDLTVEYAEARLKRNFISTSLILVGLLIILWIVMYLFIRRTVLCRLKKITQSTLSFGRGDFSARSHVSSRDEMGLLSEMFNSMAEDVTTSYHKLEKEITRRKEAEEKQLNLLHDLETANKELRDFAYITSHDLKAPLRAIATLAEWLKTDYADQLGEEGRKQLEILSGRVKRMHNLIDGILQYSRVGRVIEEKAELNLNEIVHSLQETLSPPEFIKVEIEDQLPSLHFDRTKMTQIFQNLMGNAIKYMDKPKGVIRIGYLEEDGFYKFRVSDNGPGIEEKHFDRIFQIFQTLQPKDQFESTGIGLTIVKKIIEKNGGRIWVESKPGEGATFWFTIPKV